MVHVEHTHLILTLLGLLALLLLAVSAASAGSGSWQEGEGVRYRTYSTPPPAYYPPVVVVPAPVVPLLDTTPDGVYGLTLWLGPSPLPGRPGWRNVPPLRSPAGPSSRPSGEGEVDSQGNG